MLRMLVFGAPFAILFHFRPVDEGVACHEFGSASGQRGDRGGYGASVKGPVIPALG